MRRETASDLERWLVAALDGAAASCFEPVVLAAGPVLDGLDAGIRKPRLSEPEPSEPEPSTSEASEPEPLASEASDPEPLASEASEPQLREPQLTESGPSEPEPLAMEASAPQLTESGPSEPEPSTSEASEAEPCEPEPSELVPSVPEPSVPEPSVPEPAGARETVGTPRATTAEPAPASAPTSAIPPADQAPTEPAPADEPAPDGCLSGVTDAEALVLAGLAPGPALLQALEDVSAGLAADVERSTSAVPGASPSEEVCDPARPRGSAPAATTPQRADGAAAGEASPEPAVSCVVLVEAIAAAERGLAHLTALRDEALGHFGLRRRREAEETVAQAQAAARATGRPVPDWARMARSTAPTEVAARLEISAAQAGDLVRRGMAAVGPLRSTGSAMRKGRVCAATGTWLLQRLADLHDEVEDSALELHRAADQEPTTGDGPAEGDEPAPGEGHCQCQTAACACESDASCACETGADCTCETPADTATDADGATVSAGSPDRPSVGVIGSVDAEAAAAAHAARVVAEAQDAALRAGASATRTAMGQRLARVVARTDAAGAALRARQRRRERTVRRWPEADGQAVLQLRGPAEDVALIGAALDARAERRQSDQRAAERAAARQEGRPFDRSALEPLDAHRFEALKEWAIAALELAGAAGEDGAWRPVARTAASRPVVHVTMPATVPAGVTSVGAWLSGYGPLGVEAALRVAADAFWRRVFTDPATGVAVGVDEGSYRPSAGAVRLVRLRHPTSTMPGSSRAAEGAQVDHVVPWRDDGSGVTEVTNLQPLGTGEHLLKHTPGGWSVARAAEDPAGDPSGGVVWRAATGHVYPVAPAVLDEGPAPPEPPAPAAPPADGFPDTPAF